MNTLMHARACVCVFMADGHTLFVLFKTCLTLSWLYHSVLQKLHHHEVVQLHQILFVGIILPLGKLDTFGIHM